MDVAFRLKYMADFVPFRPHHEVRAYKVTSVSTS